MLSLMLERNWYSYGPGNPYLAPYKIINCLSGQKIKLARISCKGAHLELHDFRA